MLPIMYACHRKPSRLSCSSEIAPCKSLGLVLYRASSKLLLMHMNLSIDVGLSPCGALVAKAVKDANREGTGQVWQPLASRQLDSWAPAQPPAHALSAPAQWRQHSSSQVSGLPANHLHPNDNVMTPA